MRELKSLLSPVCNSCQNNCKKGMEWFGFFYATHTQQCSKGPLSFAIVMMNLSDDEDTSMAQDTHNLKAAASSVMVDERCQMPIQIKDLKAGCCPSYFSKIHENAQAICQHPCFLPSSVVASACFMYSSTRSFLMPSWPSASDKNALGESL